MTHLEIWLLALALAVDCFTVSIATGVTTKRVIHKPMLAMALSFGIFQGGMTWLGYVGVCTFSHYLHHIDHWIAFSLLAYLGIRMIYESFHESSGIENTSKLLSLINILTMSVATSIDALAVGISFACISAGQSLNIIYPVLVIAFCSFLLSIIGIGIGIKLGKKLYFHVEALGGTVLIIIGIKILIEHLQ